VLQSRGEDAHLRYFLLNPDFRGIGLGKKLMDMFVNFAVECGYRSVYLWTTNEQEKASVIYKKYGFTLTEEKKSDTFGKSLMEQKYVLILESK